MLYVSSSGMMGAVGVGSPATPIAPGDHPCGHARHAENPSLLPPSSSIPKMAIRMASYLTARCVEMRYSLRTKPRFAESEDLDLAVSHTWSPVASSGNVSHQVAGIIPAGTSTMREDRTKHPGHSAKDVILESPVLGLGNQRSRLGWQNEQKNVSSIVTPNVWVLNGKGWPSGSYAMSKAYAPAPVVRASLFSLSSNLQRSAPRGARPGVKNAETLRPAHMQGNRASAIRDRTVCEMPNVRRSSEGQKCAISRWHSEMPSRRHMDSGAPTAISISRTSLKTTSFRSAAGGITRRAISCQRASLAIARSEIELLSNGRPLAGLTCAVQERHSVNPRWEA